MEDAKRFDEPRASVLLAEPIPGQAGLREEGAEAFHILAVPRDPTRLEIDDAGRPSLSRFEAGIDTEAHGAGARPPRIDPCFLAADDAAGERLIMISAPGASSGLNGLPAPLVTPLALGDALVARTDLILHVSRRIQAEPIATPARLVGRACEVCLLAFTPESRVIVCGSCGAARHQEGEDVPAEDRLECASLGPCPVCRSERADRGGLAYVPKASVPKDMPFDLQPDSPGTGD